MPEKDVLIEEIERVHKNLTDLRQEYWLHYDLFSYQWWLLLTVFVISWVVWWRLVDKHRLKEVASFGVSMSYLIYILDHVGYELNLWLYPHKFMRILPEAFILDLGILPILHMLVFQYFREWKSFIIANTLLAAVLAFICEPISVWLGIYKMLNWAHIYSFPIYILKAVMMKRLFEIIIRKQNASTNAER
ncbi:hypothetical protein SAMN02799630_01773 [Paenibacillus sp. UNCCL117]|uniref:CBO0543 family protein n=1 Tax=unclassified Paenibacillus TaxID=185978 RepID=UPI000886A0E2|nr:MULTISPECIES: CBO0543 family protein [unclassified Paenibacillus]SDC93444.1 hypothetical protein SAMN04488602_104261 [Paenibacillus sp. cl123]SFW29560.1 hypothetical protein SAMN02799630_01773 [Paenibacillus sp. UNCCL117]